MPQAVLKKEWGTAKCSFSQNHLDFQTDLAQNKTKKKTAANAAFPPAKALFVRLFQKQMPIKFHALL